MNKILFVCTGNTCRSPLAEYIMKDLLKQAGIKDVRVSSAGISAFDGDKMSKNSAFALKKLGIKPYGFKSKKLTVKMIEKSTIVLCMTVSHKSVLTGFSNVYTLSEAVGCEDIPDPFGQNEQVYLETAKILQSACAKIVEEIIKTRRQ